MDEPLTVNIACPYCDNQHPLVIESAATIYESKCPKCKRAYKTQVVTVRGKNATAIAGSMIGGHRISLRGEHLTGADDLIEFVGLENPEARSGDFVAINWMLGKKGDRVGTFQNLKIKKFWRLTPKPTKGCMGCGATAVLLLAGTGIATTLLV